MRIAGARTEIRWRWLRCAGCAVAASLAVAFVVTLCASAQATVTRSGTLEATVEENLRTGESTTRYRLESRAGEIAVRPTVLAAEPGDRVVVVGEVLGGRIVGRVESTATTAEPALAVTPRKVAVLLLTFPGHPDEPWPVEETRSRVFTAGDSASAFYAEESHGEISLTGKLRADGDVFGWLRLDTATAGCPYSAWRDEADEAAAAAGIDLTGYQHVIYAFPHQGSCFWNGAAGIHSDWSMINGNLGVKTITHELGHNLGLRHAGSWTCTSGGVRVQISDTCATREYGDPFDTQGNIATRHHNGWNLFKLGVLGPSNVQTVDAPGTYSVRSALHPTSEPTVLRIPRTQAPVGSVASWYYLEVRETGGVFENVFDASTTGVSIRVTAAGASPETLLLDANPATATFADAPLGVGQTFDGGSLWISTLAAGGGSATVAVAHGPPPEPTTPTVPDRVPPNDPSEPPQGLELALRMETRSLRELLRTGKLAVAVRPSVPARVTLTGSARLELRARRSARTRLVPVFATKTARFAAAGRKVVALTLSRKGRRALRGLRKVRLVIAAQGTRAGGETTRQRVVQTLRRPPKGHARYRRGQPAVQAVASE